MDEDAGGSAWLWMGTSAWCVQAGDKNGLAFCYRLILFILPLLVFDVEYNGLLKENGPND